MIVATRPKQKHPSEAVCFGFDLGPLLRNGELLTGTPTISCTAVRGAGGATGDLTITQKTVNATAFDDDDGGTVAVGEGAQALISGGVLGVDYELTVMCGTDGTPAQTRGGTAWLQIRGE